MFYAIRLIRGSDRLCALLGGIVCLVFEFDRTYRGERCGGRWRGTIFEAYTDGWLSIYFGGWDMTLSADIMEVSNLASSVDIG